MKRWLILTIILIVLFAGCIGNTIKNPGKDDIQLKISMQNKVYSLNTPFINLSIQIINTANEDVHIYNNYKIMIVQEITLPNNYSLEKISIDDFSKDRIILESQETKEFTINLIDQPFNLNGSHYNWDIEGEYRIRCKYPDKENTFYSEQTSFEIKR